ncbi:DNA mismatch repair protein MutL [Planctomycetales bacterium]|nr:DNA mismatch repair protein MutL [Planctomycetales bacterium]
MPTIKTLSQSMINKIAAGEVIERPASVIKELVENSIDAGSTRIDIAVENGGANLIRIVDDGIGIAADQLHLALSPHATSKIADTDDLFRIATFGFRGEALASVAEISQMSIKSRTAEHHEGAEIRSNGGERIEPVPCGVPVGSQIEVRNLFFNTPVRRRYMKSTTTEFGHIAETFVRLVLPQPKIHFTLKHNGRVVHDLPPDETPLARIRQLFGEDVVRDLIYIESPPRAVVRVTGYVSHPNQSRANNRMQYFFLNHRFIRDRSLQHALNEAYRGMLTVGRFPIAFLQIEMPTDMFDVNVHPTKMEVRFLDTNKVYSGFLSAIREKFLSTDLRGKFHSDTAKKGITQDNATPPWEEESATVRVRDPNDPRTALADSVIAEIRNKTQHSNNEQASHEPGGMPPVTPGIPGTLSPARNVRSPLSLHSLPDRPAETAPAIPRQYSPVNDHVPSLADHATFTPEGKLVAQMHNSYLVLETADGIALIDQHALHERVLYEQLKERMSAGHLESQRLLVPVPVDLSPNELAVVLENLVFFKSLGLQVEQFGGNTVLVSAFPAILAKTPPTEILLSLIEPILASGKKSNRVEQIDEMLHSMACKAAVKAGDKIRPDALVRLVELAEKEINSHHCPHGRPSSIVFTREELDKMFKRI